MIGTVICTQLQLRFVNRHEILLNAMQISAIVSGCYIKIVDFIAGQILDIVSLVLIEFMFLVIVWVKLY